ncbi:MAG: pantoate--beta-alanine ligase, partial [Anaerolineae bacterium]|nr:pantoate--beta-alanine ligase [Anaerolineae bacterium]
MLIVRTAAALRRWRDELSPKTFVGFVPTMGYLHEGHASLLREARRRAGDGVVVLSIFVNPTQFGPSEDLERYPRDEAGDLATARACGVDVAFCPQRPAELYPSGEGTWVEVKRLDAGLCGAARPGHF